MCIYNIKSSVLAWHTKKTLVKVSAQASMTLKVKCMDNEEEREASMDLELEQTNILKNYSFLH